MENQFLFNCIVGVAGFLLVFVFNSMTRKIQKIEDSIASMPKEYVQKDDYRADIADIKAILKQIFDKLDAKQDKWKWAMDTFDLLVKGWPILLALITLIIVLSKLDLRVAVLEEKVKVLFEQMNKMRDK